VISLLARSVADLLELDLESGRRVELGRVGGGSIVAYVHEIETGFAEQIRYPVRYAIATAEEVPNLLGRLDVFDRLQIDFDANITGTRLSAPWLDQGNRRIYDFLMATEQHILEHWHSMGLPAPVPEALRRLLNRMDQLYASALGLIKLHQTYSAPLHIRAMFEVWLQAAYLLQDPKERAMRYLEFQHVTRYRQAKRIAENPTGPISKYIADSPDRAAGEPRNQREYDRVKHLFEQTTKKGKKVAGNWYGMKIVELARRLGYEGEYRVIYSGCAWWAHADPFRTGDAFTETLTTPTALFTLSIAYLGRLLLGIADAGKIVLSNEQYEVLKKLEAQWH
jgi:hypothetical protein